LEGVNWTFLEKYIGNDFSELGEKEWFQGLDKILEKADSSSLRSSE
jgi:hypothetical protein